MSRSYKMYKGETAASEDDYESFSHEFESKEHHVSLLNDLGQNTLQYRELILSNSTWRRLETVVEPDGDNMLLARKEKHSLYSYKEYCRVFADNKPEIFTHKPARTLREVQTTPLSVGNFLSAGKRPDKRDQRRKGQSTHQQQVYEHFIPVRESDDFSHSGESDIMAEVKRENEGVVLERDHHPTSFYSSSTQDQSHYPINCKSCKYAGYNNDRETFQCGAVILLCPSCGMHVTPSYISASFVSNLNLKEWEYLEMDPECLPGRSLPRQFLLPM
jgi:hypothetical protein